MKVFKSWLGLGLVFATAALGAGVNYDYDGDTDFASFSAYAWKSSDTRLSNPMAEERVRRALEEGFTARGFELRDAREADFLVDFRATVGRDVRVDETWWSWGGGRRGRGRQWVREIDVTTYPVGTLAVVVIDSASGEVVWRGVVSGALASNPSANQKRIKKAVKKLLKKFPPPA